MVLNHNVAKKYDCEINSIRTDLMTEITVQKKGGNTYDEMQQSYHDLLQYVSENDYDARKMIQPLQMETSGLHTYVYAELPCDLSKHNTIEDIIASLKTLHGGNVVLNFTIVNGNVNGNIFMNGNKIETDSKEIARQWICKNPPKNREKKSDYYNRYKKENKEILVDSAFSKIVSQFGKYDSLKSNGSRYWIVK